MAWPSTPVAVGDLIQASQLNLIAIQIADITLSVTAASAMDFTSIPQGFSHLLVVGHIRDTGAVTATNPLYRFNADTGSNYDYLNMGASGSTVSCGETFAQTRGLLGSYPGASAPAGVFGALDIFIPYYANSSYNKALRAITTLKGGTTGGSLGLNATSNFWRSNVAINEFTLIAGNTNFAVGSRATLYGLP